MRTLSKALFFILFTLVFVIHFSIAQEQDAGLWLTATVEKKLNKNFKLALSEEFRFKENISQLGTYFTDIGLQYKISKSFSASFNYRYIQKQRIDLSYAARTRFYIDFAYKYKADKWNFILRTRFQNQLKEISFERNFSDPSIFWRNKLTIKYSGKKFTPYLSVETFTPINNPKEYFLDELRLSAGCDYELNKKSTVNVFYMIDKQIYVNAPVTSFIIGLGYVYSF